ncbi:MAG: hypothetical protein GF311_02910 [Candidatus Lokiarchaeota archaeon]|nr:hypothetical protein [Candidatus Lokiarchaeota archaeon]
MKLHIFQRYDGTHFRRIYVNVVKFGIDYLLIMRNKSLNRIVLEKDHRTGIHNLFALLTDDLIHGFVEKDDFSVISPMPYIISHPLLSEQLSKEYQERLLDVEMVYKKKMRAIDNTISALTENFHESYMEIFLVLGEILLRGVDHPGFLCNLREKIPKIITQGGREG